MFLDTPNDAELAVLGAVVATGGQCLDELTLQPEDFMDARHGWLYQQMLTMYAEGKHIDQVTLAGLHPKAAPFVWSLTDHAPFAHAFRSYAEIVASQGMNRRIQNAAAGLGQIEPTLPVTDQAQMLETIVDRAIGLPPGRIEFGAPAMAEFTASAESTKMFYPSPWPSLDNVIGGLRPGAMYVIGARPGVGKSVVGMQIAMALQQHGVVAFSSLEMTRLELTGRMISSELGIYQSHIKNGTMTDKDWEVLATNRAMMDAVRVSVDDRAHVGPADIRQFARQVGRHGDLTGIVVDYLQLMDAPGNREDRHVLVAKFSRQLKVLAKDLQVPVIVLSQLNRQVEGRPDGLPRMSELRESGAIEQDADVVILLSRPKTDEAEETIVFDVAKNRHGRTDTFTLRWEGAFSKVSDYGELPMNWNARKAEQNGE